MPEPPASNQLALTSYHSPISLAIFTIVTFATGFLGLWAYQNQLAANELAYVGFPTNPAVVRTAARVCPSILSFTATPGVIAVGQSSTLEYSFKGGKGATFVIDHEVGDVTDSTVKVVAPSETTEYTLRASKPRCGDTEKRVTVTVE